MELKKKDFTSEEVTEFIYSSNSQKAKKLNTYITTNVLIKL